MVDFTLSQLPHKEADVVVIGAGIAGLYSAIKVAEKQRVLMITKKSLFDSNTRYSQGGIAAVIAEDDLPAFHRDDTLFAGAGLCSTAAVDVLVNEGPQGVRELIRMGTQFDLEDGVPALTKEGAHSRRRILHAHGDATGAEIVRALAEKLLHNPNIELWEEHFAIDLITDRDECCGVLVQKPDGERVYVSAKATVLCTGGSGQLYRYTTNPEIATGDGVAIAFRAGALIRDMEFIQFHPTVLCYPGAPRFLISEALRGEGAVLRNLKGERFMASYHELMELAPRDVVARSILNEMEKEQSTFVYIDITHEPAEMIKHRFPTIYETCLGYGLDLTTDWIPVAPAAHYMMGGIRTGLHGETSIHRLFACGEAASTGVHGANRLASNSLSEAVVFGKRIADRINRLHDRPPMPVVEADMGRTGASPSLISEKKLRLQKIMLRHVGLKRTMKGLKQAGEEWSRMSSVIDHSRLTSQEEMELANMLACTALVTSAALKRQESRGAHYRNDYPDRDDERWCVRLLQHREKGMSEEALDHA